MSRSLAGTFTDDPAVIATVPEVIAQSRDHAQHGDLPQPDGPIAP
jgi:hypothetical protein